MNLHLERSGGTIIIPRDAFKAIREAGGRICISAKNHTYGKYYQVMVRYHFLGDKGFTLSRLLVGAGPGEVVDHINRNGLDNSYENLRIISDQENRWNRTKSDGKLSKYKGVFFYRGGKIGGQIRHKEKIYRKYGFKTEEAAAAWYDRTAAELRGEFACLNFHNNSK